MFKKIISELGFLLNLRDLAPDNTGALTLRIDGQDFILQYFDQGQEIYIIHRLGTLPENTEDRARIQGLLLERNCFFRGVGTGTIGTEDSGIYYTVRLRADSLNGHELEQFMRAVTTVCEQIRRDMDDKNVQTAFGTPLQNILWG